jgi:hypothetical protein
MSEPDDDGHWHLDKRVPLALIASIFFGMLVQTLGAVWWASGMSARVDELERKVTATAPQSERIKGLEVNMEVVKDGIAEIKRLIRRESP